MTDDAPVLSEFDGQRTSWRTFKKQRNGFKKLHKIFFKGYANIPDPRKRDRVTTAYTVDEDEDNDPTGAEPGDNVRVESPQQKKKKEKQWTEVDELWFHIQYNAIRGKARTIADEMTAESGAELELKLDAHYDGTSNSHAAYNLVEWVQDKRQPTESVEDFSEKWHDRCKNVEANLDWQSIKCLLFLRALGPKYRSFMDIATNSKEKLDLHDLMKRAADHRRGEHENEEADHINHALNAAEQQTDQAKTRVTPSNNDYLRPCAICGNRFHCKAECFKPGGGLAHLSADERRGWLDAQRTQREHRRQLREQRDGNSGQHKNPHMQWRRNDRAPESANVAAKLAEENERLRSKMKAAEKTIKDYGVAIPVDLRTHE